MCGNVAWLHFDNWWNHAFFPNSVSQFKNYLCYHFQKIRLTVGILILWYLKYGTDASIVLDFMGVLSTGFVPFSHYLVRLFQMTCMVQVEIILEFWSYIIINFIPDIFDMHQARMLNFSCFSSLLSKIRTSNMAFCANFKWSKKWASW